MSEMTATSINLTEKSLSSRLPLGVNDLDPVSESDKHAVAPHERV